MAERTILLTLAIVLAVALSQPAGQRPDTPGPAERRTAQPRTTWGDPDLEGVWTSDNNERPYTAVLDLKPQGSIFEYACHERNRGLANILSAARAEERVANSPHNR